MLNDRMKKLVQKLQEKRKKPFFSPRFVLPLAWSVDMSYSALLKLLFNIDEIVIHETDRQMLRSLQNDRLLHFSNHPTYAEPAIAYYIANEMGARFNYMASRTLFDWYGGAIGEFIRSLGGFSVLAGAADRESLKMARQCLARKRGKLVLYPEGMNNWENDNMVSFQSGAIQIAFWGMEDARKIDPKADITILPSFVKYVMSGPPDKIQKELKDSLSKLERELGINPGDKKLLRRFLTVGRVLLEDKEKEYGITPDPNTKYEERVGNLRHRILDDVAELIQMKGYQRDADVISKIRQLYLIVETVNAGFPDPRLAGVNREIIKAAEKQLRQAYNFSVINPDYLLERPTAERCYEWLYRFEAVVHGEYKLRPRRAHMLFARTFRMSQFYDDYKKDKRGTVEALTRRLRSDLEELLEQSTDLTGTIAKPWDVGADLEHVYPGPAAV